MNELDSELLEATGRGDTPAIEDLIERGADSNCRDQWMNTPLSNASWGGHVGALEVLYKSGADIYRERHEGDDLLSHTVFNAQIDSVKWLLSKGVDPNHISKKTGESALHAVITKKAIPAGRKL